MRETIYLEAEPLWRDGGWVRLHHTWSSVHLDRPESGGIRDIFVDPVLLPSEHMDYELPVSDRPADWSMVARSARGKASVKRVVAPPATTPDDEEEDDERM